MSGVTEATKRPRWWRRRTYQAVAAFGGAVVLVTGAVVAQQAGRNDGRTVTDGGRRPWQGDPLATGPALGRGGRVQPGAPAAPGAPGATTRGTRSGSKASAKAVPNEPVESPTTTTIDIDGVAATVTTSGSMPLLHHTMRVVSARADLSGQRELAWAADAGHRVGDAKCTQNFRFNPDSSARVRPTLLLCWRTSATKTVYTVAVDVDHRPSEQASLALIDQVWTKLG
jgi:hypothetical protein